MTMRGIRGATIASHNQADDILQATSELLRAILDANPALQPEDIASAFFTMTNDLTAVYPAQAARQLGWTQVPLLCAQEVPVPSSLPHTIRVLLHWNTDLPQSSIHHVYLGQAAALRPDIS